MLLKDKFVTIDVEASGLDILSKSFKLGGVGISDSEEGFYLAINSLEDRNELTEEQITKFNWLLNWLETNKVILVYNQSYEIRVMKRIFNYDIKVQDVLVLATTLDTRGSLKDNTRKWVFGLDSDSSEPIYESDDEDSIDSDDEFWEKNVSLWNKNFSKIIKAYMPKNGKENKHWTSFLEQYAVMSETGSVSQPEHKIKGLNEGYTNLFTILDEELEPEEIGYTKSCLFETIISRVQSGYSEVDFTYLPEKMVSKYCIDDCINTCKLFKVFAGMLSQGDYKRAYNSYNNQTLFAIELENNGIAWDEEAAQLHTKNLQEHLVARMKSLILNPKSVEHLQLSDEQILEVKTTDDLEMLTGHINPRSIKTREIVSKVIFSKSVKIAWLLEASRDFIKKQQNYGRSVLSKMEKFLDLPYGTEESLLDIIPDLGPVVYLYREKGKASEKEFMNSQLDLFELPGFNKEIIAKIKIVFERYFGIDFSSWDSINSMPECKFYVDIFLCKKIAKEISGFDSKLGRDCVTSKENLALENASDYFYQGRFNPCAVTTKRWSSQYHTIGTGSHLRDCLISKHGEDGILFHTDLSQNEVRVAGTLAKEEKLMEAYRNGLDIHKLSASTMYKKSIDEVTSTERSVAKAMTFGLLYGKSPASFVEDGVFKNLEEANKAFDDFYSGYPNLSAWMQSKKDEVMTNGYVTTAYGDKIFIEFDRNKDNEVSSAQRDAVNYPIQHYASCSAALTFQKVSDSYKSEGLSFSSFAFTHDALDIDVHVKDFFKVLYTLKDKVNSTCLEISGIFMENDPAVGATYGQQFEYKIIDQNTFQFSGDEDKVKEICNRLSKYYTLEISYEDDGERLINLKELFMKHSYNTLLDTPIKQTKAIIKHNYFSK